MPGDWFASPDSLATHAFSCFYIRVNSFADYAEIKEYSVPRKHCATNDPAATPETLMASPREDRRRRIRSEDAKPAPAKKPARTTRASSKLYSAGALTTAQPRISELVPRRKRWMAAWFFAAIVPVLLVQQLYLFRVGRIQSVAEQAAAQNLSVMQQQQSVKVAASKFYTLHLFGVGTIGNWVASTFLIISAAGCLIVYSIRRHKVDDYGGRYRVWLWVAGFLAICSLDASTGIHRLFMFGMMHVTRRELWAGGTGWWLFSGATVGGILAILVLRDIWRSRGASLAFIVAIACYVGATLFYLRKYSIGSNDQDMMAWSTQLLCGHALLFYSVLLYLRFIKFEAAGEIAAKAAKSRKENPNAKPRLSRSLSQQPKDRPKRVRKVTTKKKVAKTTASDEAVSESVATDSDDAAAPKSRKLLRKQKQQQRRAA